MKFDQYTMRVTDDGIDVVGWGTYPDDSVLAGQTSINYLDSFETEAEARKAYPKIDGFSSKWSEPRVSLNHLPEDDSREYDECPEYGE